MRIELRFLPALALILAYAGCHGSCAGEPARPTRYLAKDAQAVLELSDLGLFAAKRAELFDALGALANKEQLEALAKELELSLGFDPTTAKGLGEAGLPEHGALAVELAQNGGGAVWALPVKDPARFDKVLDKIARARAVIEATEKLTVAEHEATVLSASFGPEKITVAAYAFDRGMAVIAAGPKAKELLERALKIGAASPPADVTTNTEYTTLAGLLGAKWELRFLLPVPPESLRETARALARVSSLNLGPALELVPELSGVKSAGWVVSLSDRAANLTGRIRLDAAALEKARRMLAVSGEAPAGVRALDSDQAVLALSTAGHLPAILEIVAPAGSPLRARLDTGFARMQQDLGTDVEKELLPILSGRAAVAIGVENLAGVDPREVLQNPARALWTSIALGATEPDRILEVEKRMEPGLKARGLGVASRKSGEREVHVVGRPEGEPGKDPQIIALVETMSLPGARVFCNSPGVTDRIARSAAAPPPDPLAGKGGTAVELRPRVLSESLRAANLSALPILVRGMAAKILQVLAMVERISAKAELAEDGVALSGRLQLSGGAGKP